MIALRCTNVPIVPIAISGSEQFKYNWRRLRRTPVRMVFGQAFHFRTQEGMPHREQMRLMTCEAMYRLAALLPPEYRGVYSDVENATMRFIVPCGPA
jgi:1-acyl-sn-glycerol-3-phosphate acyltransferase